MSIRQPFTLCLLLLLGSAPASAFAYEVAQGGNQFYSSTPLKDIETVALEIKGLRDNLPYGINSEKLYNVVRERLEAAGFRVVSVDELQTADKAGLLKFGIHLNENSYYYSYGLNLSLGRKITIDGGYTTVQAWTDGKVGALTSNELTRLPALSLDLVNNFISAHQQQNAG